MDERKRADLLGRARQMSGYGNYWATKCVALIGENERLEREVEALRQEVMHWRAQHNEGRRRQRPEFPMRLPEDQPFPQLAGRLP